jgi:16S rRNA (uracil1498-N3)-methyltransferase
MNPFQRLVVAPGQMAGNQVDLTPAQQHYLSRVLRLRPGDRFIAMDGHGQWWLVALTENAAQGQVLMTIAVATELPITVTLLIAMPKTGLDDVVRQATELGVSQIVPIHSARTVLNPSPQKVDRWQRIAQEAAEQSERQVVPVITAPLLWSDALQTWNTRQSICYICQARDHHPHLLTCLEEARNQRLGGGGWKDELSATQAPQPSRPILAISLATGPEGGWTESELAVAIDAGYQPVSLGDRILRAVTAPLVGLSLIASVFEAERGNGEQG